MNLALLKKELKEKRTTLIIYCLAGAMFVWLYVSIYPSLQSSANQLAKLMASLPKEMLKAFGIEGTGLENAESLLSSKQFGLVWPLMAIFMLLARAAGSIAGEIESGTMGTLLSQPISRSKIFISKYASTMLALLLFVITTVLINIPILKAYKLGFSLKYELWFALISFLFGWAIVSTSYAVSAVVSEKSKVYSIIGGTVLAMFVLNIVSGLKPSVDFLKYASIFYYFRSSEIMVLHHVNYASIILFLAVAIIGFALGLSIFNKRDITT